MNDIYNIVKNKTDDILLDIEKVVKKQSPTKRKDLADLCKEQLMELFSDHLKIESQIIKDETYGDHLRYEIGDGDEQILIIGHYDTVWDEDELPFEIKGNKAHGPGILDMKSGLIIALWALKTLDKAHYKMKKKIVFLLNSDHEGVASPHSRKYIEKEAMKSVAVLVPEASTDHTNKLKIERKGILRYRISIEGKAAHAGNNHEEGVNAILELSKLIVAISHFTNYDVGTTVNVGEVRGGQGINVVPEYAECNIDIRVKNNEEAENMKEQIESLYPSDSCAKINIEGGIVRPAMVKTKASEKLLEIAKTCGKQFDYEIKAASVGGGSDGSFASALHIPTLDGLGGAGVGPHSREEHILIDHLPKRVALFTSLLIGIDKEF